MKKQSSILSENLKKLLYKRHMYPADLAQAVNLSAPTVHRLVTGKSTRPYRSSLEPIAHFFSVTVEQLTGEQPIKWSTEEPQQLEDIGIYRIPLLEWENVHSWLNNSESTDVMQTVITEASVGRKAFSLIIKDASMSPLFPLDTKIIFDPERSVKDRCYVLTQMKACKEPVFRQIIIDAGDRFLKPLSPDLENFRMYMLEKNDVILGVLVEAKREYS